MAVKQKNLHEDPFWRKPKQQSIFSFTQKQEGQREIVAKEKEKEKEQEEQDTADFENFLNHKKYQDDDLQPYCPPPSFSSTLYTYQQTALSWLLMREGAIATRLHANVRLLHPLWQEYKLPPSHSLYFSPFNGQLSFRMPHSAQECRGGILADEMGLGKTIMMIALIHTHRPNARYHQENQSAAKLIKKNKFFDFHNKFANTLIVLPLMLLS